MKVSDIEEKIKADKAEIAAIEVEKEDVVCKSYNVYNKKEIIDIMNVCMKELDLVLKNLSYKGIDIKKNARARYLVSWIASRIYSIHPSKISEMLNISERIVYHGRIVIDKAIKNKDNETLEATFDLCKDLNLIREKTDGNYSPSDWYNTLSRYLHSELQNTLRTHGNMSKMAMTDTKQPYSDTLSSTRAEKSVTQKADYPTSLTQHGTRSFLLGSDIAWAIRETARNTNLTTKEERAMYYNALLAACEWGRKCDYENRKRKSELKDQNIYSSIID